jgi:trehalose 6-phosphate phosphatase
MPHVLQNAATVEQFYGQLGSSQRRILMLDYDGTLAPFVVKRDEAVPYPGVREILSRIMAGKQTRVVIVTGRAVRDVLPLLAIDPLPEIWGSHGWERRSSSGDYVPPVLSSEAKGALEEAIRWAKEAGLAEQLEQKPSSVACHWRGMDELQVVKLRARVAERWGQFSHSGGLELKPFDGGFELSVPGRTKGDAVRSILEGEDDKVPAAFLGDDRTDEDAFQALEGRGLRVLVRTEHRDTAADLWLTPPEELLAFLEHWV